MGLDEELFNLKFTSKMLMKESVKMEKEMAKEKVKLKKAIEKGVVEGARIYSANVIRLKNQSLNFLRLSSRIDAVASRVESAIRMNQVSKSMSGIVKAMGTSLSSMNPEKISLTMDAFERQFADLDVQSEFVEQAMAGSVAMSTPQEEVDALIAQVAEEHALNVSFMMPSAPAARAQPAAAAATSDHDDVLARLEKLKQ